MRTENRVLLGFNVPVVGIVDTLKEAIEASGSEEAVVKDFNAYVLAHSHFTVLRKVIIKKLVEKTGIKQLTAKDGDKEVVIEKDAAYIARLQTELGEEVVNGYEKEIAEACAAEPVDYKPGVRGAGGSATPAKKWLAYYDQLVTEEKLDAFCAKWNINQTDVDEETLRVTVANKVKEIVSEKQRKAEAEAMAV